MGLLQGTVVLLCAVIMTITPVSTQAVSCADGWRLFGGNCYRLTDSSVRHDQLTSTCRQMGGEAVSVHSSQENDFVANVAGGKYVWIGLKVTGPAAMTWEDNSPYSYSKFLPAGNSMLKQRFTGAGVYQQSCRRWNFGAASQLRYGVCRAPAGSCPTGALDRDGRCYFLSSRPVPWWDAAVACHETDRHAAVANLNLQDWQLNMAVTGNFAGSTILLVQVENEFSPQDCRWTTTQYGQRTTRNCSFGCADLHTVLCSRPRAIGNRQEPPPPMRAVPPTYQAPTATEPLTASECPPDWTDRGTRCVSGPTRPTTRLMADLYCQQMDGRMATVRGDLTRPQLVLQLREEIQVWVLDHTAAAIQYSIFEKKLSEGYTTNLMLPGYSALTATGEVIARPAEMEMPAICERCRLPCSSGAVNFAGHCYQLLEEERSLTNATRSCTALGGGLVSIESLVENNFVTALAFPASSAQCAGGSEAWLGLSRGSVAFSWQWQDCSEYGIQFWVPGDERSGYCSTLDAAGRWHSSDRCGQLRRLTVCEWDPCQTQDQYSAACRALGQGPVY